MIQPDTRAAARQMVRMMLPMLLISLLQLTTHPARAQQLQVSFSGYIQALMQSGTTGDYVKVGKGILPDNKPVTRVGIRRGRFTTKAAFGDLEAKLELQANEHQVSVQNIYLTYAPKPLKGLYFRAGLANVDFGYELPYSSSKRPAFDRALYLSDLFPGDTDMGLTIGCKLHPGASDRWKIDGIVGLWGGNANKGMIKNMPDLSLRMAVQYKDRSDQVSFGLSGYGGYLPSPDGYYAFTSSQAVLKQDKKMARAYGGAFVDGIVTHRGGRLTLSAEGIAGIQPGWQNANLAVGSKAPATFENNIFIQRPFVAAMAQIVERIKPAGGFPDLELFGRYAYYDRNRHFDPAVSQDLKINNLTARTEGTTHQVSTGLNYFLVQEHLRLSLHYDCFLTEGYREAGAAPDVAGKPIHLVTVGAQYKF